MMNLNRNQKLSLFVFGCPDKTKTVRDLMFAGTMAGDTPLRRHLWELAYCIREESAGAEDFDEIFCTVREELEPMLYAPLTTYDEENGCYATVYPLYSDYLSMAFKALGREWIQDFQIYTEYWDRTLTIDSLYDKLESANFSNAECRCIIGALLMAGAVFKE